MAQLQLTLIFGMLFIGWPAVTAWLAYAAGRNLPDGWYLPVLLAWISRFQSGWLLGDMTSWIYAAALLMIGLMAMIISAYTGGNQNEE